MKPRQILMAAGLAGAAWLALFGDKTPGNDADLTPLRHPDSFRRAAAQPDSTQAEGEIAILALQPRAGMAAGSRHGLFAGKSFAPPPKPVELAPAPAPTAPPLPFTYLGKQHAAGHVDVFLARGSEVLIVRDHTVIGNTYRIESVRPPVMTLTYLPLNQMQQLNIGAMN